MIRHARLATLPFFVYVESSRLHNRRVRELAALGVIAGHFAAALASLLVNTRAPETR